MKQMYWNFTHKFNDMLVSAQNIQNIKKYCQFAAFNHSTFRQLLAANWVKCYKGGTAWPAGVYRPGYDLPGQEEDWFYSCPVRVQSRNCTGRATHISDVVLVVITTVSYGRVECWLIDSSSICNKNTFRGQRIHGYYNSTTNLVVVDCIRGCTYIR